MVTGAALEETRVVGKRVVELESTTDCATTLDDKRTTATLKTLRTLGTLRRDFMIAGGLTVRNSREISTVENGGYVENGCTEDTSDEIS